MPISKIISFIWAGGAKALPEDNHAIIEGWRKENPGFQTILWVSQPLPESVRKLYAARGYQFALSGSKDGEGLHDLEHIIKQTIAEPDSIKGSTMLMDINTLFSKAAHYFSSEALEKLKAIIYYEMNKFTPNYGASSDLLRYLVLLVYGGAYFDSDVPSLGKLNEELPYTGPESEYFTLPDFSQGRKGFGNDAFVCSPGHPITKSLIQRCLTKYVDDTGVDDYETFDHHWATIYRTGPGIVKDVLREFGKSTVDGSLLENFKLFPKYSDENVPAARPGSNWVKAPQTQCETMQEALQIAVFSMTTEASCMGVCRFSDHAYHIGRSLKQDLITPLAHSLLANEKYLKFRDAFLACAQGYTFLFDTAELRDSVEGLLLQSHFNMTADNSVKILRLLYSKTTSDHHRYGQLKNVIQSEYFATIFIEQNLLSPFIDNSTTVPENITTAYQRVSSSTGVPYLKGEVTWNGIQDFLEKTRPRIDSSFNDGINKNLINQLSENNFLKLLKQPLKHAQHDAQISIWEHTRKSAYHMNVDKQEILQKIDAKPSSSKEMLPPGDTPTERLHTVSVSSPSTLLISSWSREEILSPTALTSSSPDLDKSMQEDVMTSKKIT